MSEDEMREFAREHGIAALLDHLGLDELGNEVESLRQQLEEANGELDDYRYSFEKVDEERFDLRDRLKTAEQQLEQLRGAGEFLDLAAEGFADVLRGLQGDLGDPEYAEALKNVKTARDKWAALSQEGFQQSKEAGLPICVSPETKRNVGLKP